MERLAILLGLNGSAESMLAARQSWEIAKAAGGTVSAVHVVDTERTWNLLGSKTPGFVGSGPYIQVYESTNELLRSLGETLTEKYQAMADGESIQGSVLVEEGSPSGQLTRLDNSHHLVVVGHRTIAEQSPAERQFKPAFGVPENIVQTCPRPLLICSEKHVPWKTLRIVVALNRFNMNYVASCVRFAEMLFLDVSVLCLLNGDGDAGIDALEAFFAGSDFTGKTSLEVQDAFAFDEFDALSSSTLHVDAAVSPYLNHLVVMPTIKTPAGAIALSNLSASSLVNNMSIPTVLLWPEEYTLPPIACRKNGCDGTLATSVS